jgi:amino acid permease
MKKVITIFTLLLAGFVSAYGTTNSSNESDKNPIELDKEKTHGLTGHERSLEYSIIEAYSYSDNEMVEVTLYNIGCAQYP